MSRPFAEWIVLPRGPRLWAAWLDYALPRYSLAEVSDSHRLYDFGEGVRLANAASKKPGCPVVSACCCHWEQVRGLIWPDVKALLHG